MALDELLEALREENRSLIEACRREAAAEARRLRGEARSSARERLRLSLDSHRSALAARLAREIDGARLEASRVELEAAQAMCERVFAAARRAAPEVGRGAEYVAALPRLLELALEGVVGEVEIRCAPPIADRLGSLTGARLAARVTADAGIGSGFVVEARGGTVRVDARLETLLAEERPALAIELLRRLEAGP